MKKLLLVLAGLFLFSQSSALADMENISVSRMSGQPLLVRGDLTLPMSGDMQCQTGDILKTTTPQCSVDMAVNGLAGCRILPLSECVIVNGSPTDMRLKITSGNAILNLKKIPAGSSFQVETPTAVAAVRGTQFWGRVDGQNPGNPVTTFAVLEGMVEITARSTGKTFTLQKGQALDIPADASVVPSIRPALDAELEAMRQASSIATSA